MIHVRVRDVLPDGFTPCVTVWELTEESCEIETEMRWGRGVATVPAVYTLLRAEAGGREYTPGELVAMWRAEGFAGGTLDLYHENLMASLADGTADERDVQVAA